MMMMLTLFSLPDELWISILSQWLENSCIIFATVDIAFCNQSLRPRYLTSLGQITKIPKKIHFDTITPYSVFFEWCEKRNIQLTSISYTEKERTNECVGKDIPTAIKSVECLKLSISASTDKSYIISSNTNGSMTSNLLNDFPKLQHLEVSMAMEKTSIPCFKFMFEPGLYPSLVCLELCRLRFPSPATIYFQELITRCPNLEIVKFKACQHINLSHMKYLLKYGYCLKSLHYEHHHSLQKIVDLKDTNKSNNNSERIRNTSIVTSLTLGGLLKCPTATNMLLSILRMCPMVEELMLVSCGVRTISTISDNAWCDTITSCWSHLHSLTLSNCALNFPIVLQAINTVCGNKLTRFVWRERLQQDSQANQPMRIFHHTNFPTTVSTWSNLQVLGLSGQFTYISLVQHLIGVKSSLLHTLMINHTVMVIPITTTTIVQPVQQQSIPLPIISTEVTENENEHENEEVESDDEVVVTSSPTITQAAERRKPAVEDYAQILQQFPLLKILHLILPPQTALMTSFAAITHIEEVILGLNDDEQHNKTIQSRSNPPPLLSINVLQGFRKLQRLTFKNFPLSKDLFWKILSLPCLQSLTLTNTNTSSSDTSRYTHASLLYPQNYPSQPQQILLSSLKEFHDEQYGIFFTEEILRVFLSRFPSLEQLTISRVSMLLLLPIKGEEAADKDKEGKSNNKLMELQKEFRYRTNIIQSVVNNK